MSAGARRQAARLSRVHLVVASAALLFLSACSQDWADGCPQEASIESLGVAKDARWDERYEDICGFDYGEPWLTPYFVYGTNLALPGALMLWLLLSFSWNVVKARRANRVGREAKGKPLSAGDSMIHGVVRDPDGEGPALKLSVEQAGTQFFRTRDNNKRPHWKTRWTEVDRKLDHRPFLLETASGNVWIEPDANAYLVDDLETHPRDGVVRLRTAEVNDGDELFVEGSLSEVADPTAGGYRGGGRVWSLRPPTGGHMRLSTKPLGAAYADRAGNRFVALVLLGVLILCGQVLAIPYHVARLTGHEEAAVVTARCVQTHPEDDDRYYARFRLLSSSERSDTRVNATDYERMKPGTVVPVSVSRAWGDPRITLGLGASTNAGVSLIPMLVILLAVVLIPILVLRARPWWEHDKLIDVVDGSLESQP